MEKRTKINKNQYTSEDTLNVHKSVENIRRKLFFSGGGRVCTVEWICEAVRF